MPISIAPNKYKRAGDLKIGDLIYTNKQGTLDFGYFAIADNTQSKQPCLTIKTTNRTVEVSKSHRFELAGTYVLATDLKVGQRLETETGYEEILSIAPAGVKTVVNFEIEEAHTYMVNGIKSHNKVDPLDPNPDPNPTGP